MKTIIALFAVLAVAVGNPLPLVQIIVNVDGQSSVANPEFPVVDRPVPESILEIPIIPDPVLLPQPVLPGGVAPEPVELPVPVLPGGVAPEPVELPVPVLPGGMVPEPVELPVPVLPEVIVPAPLPVPVLPVIVPQPVVLPEDIN